MQEKLKVRLIRYCGKRRARIRFQMFYLICGSLLKTCVFPINHTLFNILYESLNFRILIPHLYIVLVIKNLCGFNIFQKNEHSHIITLAAIKATSMHKSFLYSIHYTIIYYCLHQIQAFYLLYCKVDNPK